MYSSPQRAIRHGYGYGISSASRGGDQDPQLQQAAGRSKRRMLDRLDGHGVHEDSFGLRYSIWSSGTLRSKHSVADGESLIRRTAPWHYDLRLLLTFTFDS